MLYGGETADGISGETWEWDGRAWSGGQRPGPEARSAASLTWDPNLRLSVLYAGNGDDGRIPDDTWGWDGTTWTRLASAGPNPGRWPAATVGSDKGVLLYGGHQVADEELPGALADTWSWSGRSWAPLPEAGGPGALVNAQGLLHPRLGPLLVGGSDLNRATGDVWQWRRTGWSLLARDVFPARQGFGLAHDADRDRVILTGGVVAPGSPERHQDVWEWAGDPEEPAVRIDARPPA